MAWINRRVAGLGLFVAGFLIGLSDDRLLLSITRGALVPEQVQGAAGETKYFSDPLGLDQGSRSTSLTGR
jgi:hypothetical protein